MDYDFGDHEVTDRASLVLELFHDNLLEHEKVQADPQLLKLANDIDKALMEFYQTASTKKIDAEYPPSDQPREESPMLHKISRLQYDQLPAWGFLRDKDLGWPAADRLLVGEGTDSDLDEVVKYCIKQNRHTLARELLQPPDQLGGVD